MLTVVLCWEEEEEEEQEENENENGEEGEEEEDENEEKKRKEKEKKTKKTEITGALEPIAASVTKQSTLYRPGGFLLATLIKSIFGMRALQRQLQVVNFNRGCSQTRCNAGYSWALVDGSR